MSNTITYTDIDYADIGECYDWCEFHVERGSDGKLYTGTDSGCSCNYYGQSFTERSECPSWIEACNRIKAWSSHPAAMQLIERLTNLKPAAFDPTVATIDGELASKEIGA